MSMRRMPKLKPVARNCQFCASKTNPDYKDVATLVKYTSERGKILAKARTGVCSKHQRHIAQELKRARIMAMLPFIVRA
jgi:small subunit ribosomal protein S18